MPLVGVGRCHAWGRPDATLSHAPACMPGASPPAEAERQRLGGGPRPGGLAGQVAEGEKAWEGRRRVGGRAGGGVSAGALVVGGAW